MSETRLEARVVRDATGTLRVLSPAVGTWSEPPASGALVGPGSPIGRLGRLNRRFLLVLPAGAAGVVSAVSAAGEVGVGHGDPLFELRALEASPNPGSGPIDPASPGASDLPPGTRAVVAPTDGVFYARPAPDAPPFVEVGATLRSGQPVGLVEVMKTFNQIVYGGPGLPDPAQVVEVRCEDGCEVAAGQTLVVVRPRSG